MSIYVGTEPEESPTHRTPLRGCTWKDSLRTRQGGSRPAPAEGETCGPLGPRSQTGTQWVRPAGTGRPAPCHFLGAAPVALKGVREDDGAAMHGKRCDSRLWTSRDPKRLGRGSAYRVLLGIVRSRSLVHRLPLGAQLGAEEMFDDLQ